MTLTVRVITPDKTVWDDEAQEVILPTSTGQIGILTDHAPLLTTLDIGVMRIRASKEWENIALMGGFAEVEENEVKILVNDAQLASDIDADSVLSEKEEAEKKLEIATQADDVRKKNKATQAVKKAKARLQATGKL